MANKRYIRPSKGGWDIVEEGHRRGTGRAATKKEALGRARELAREEGGGEVLVLNSHGKVTDADTVDAPKSGDPARPPVSARSR